MLSVIDAVVPSTLNNWIFCPSISGENTSIGAKLTSARFNKQNKFFASKNESSLGNRKKLRRIKNQTLEPNFYSANPIRKQPRLKPRKKREKRSEFY